MPLDPDLQEFTTTQQSVASYNYTDIDEGTGTVIYFGALTSTVATGGEFILNRTFLIGVAQHNRNLGNPNEYNLAAFNTPKIARGTAIVEITITGASGLGNLSVQLKKFDGTTETNISSSIVKGSVQNDSFLFLIPLTETVFAEGDNLRLEVSVGQNQGNTRFTSDTPFKLHMPYKLNI